VLPEDGRNFVADEPVEHAARLLRVHEILVDRPRLTDRLLHDILRDLIEGHALRLIVRDVQQIFEVPGNCLSLAVRVGREKDAAAFVGGFPKLLDDVLLALERLILRLKAMLDIHAHRALRQIAQMSHAGLDQIIRTQVFSDGFRFRGRFHDHETGFRFRHELPPYPSFSAREKRFPGSLLTYCFISSSVMDASTRPAGSWQASITSSICIGLS